MAILKRRARFARRAGILLLLCGGVFVSLTAGTARGDGPIVVDLNLSSPTIEADGNDTITLTATARNLNDGSPVEGVSIRFDADYLTTMEPTGSVTDVSGEVTCAFATIDDGNYYVYAEPAMGGVGAMAPVQAVASGQ